MKKKLSPEQEALLNKFKGAEQNGANSSMGNKNEDLGYTLSFIKNLSLFLNIYIIITGNNINKTLKGN